MSFISYPIEGATALGLQSLSWPESCSSSPVTGPSPPVDIAAAF